MDFFMVYCAYGWLHCYSYTEDTKWKADTDEIIPMDIKRAKAVYSDGSLQECAVANGGYLCYTKGSQKLKELYFYNDASELQEDYTDPSGPQLGEQET